MSAPAAHHLRQPDNELRAALDSSKERWNSNGRRGEQLILPNADLRRMDLREQILSEGQFQGADLRGACLDSAVMARAVLDGALLNGASMFRVDGSFSSVRHVEMAGVQAPLSRWVRSTFARTDLTGALLDDADFSHAELMRSSMDRASLVRANFAGAALLGSTFTDAQLRGAVFSGAVATAGALEGGFDYNGLGAIYRDAPKQRRRTQLDYELAGSVAAKLDGRGYQAHIGFTIGPDIVVESPDHQFWSVEVKTSTGSRTLRRAASSADLIVVPDDHRVPDQIDDVLIRRVSDIDVSLFGSLSRQPKRSGAVAVAIRQADRLRPYLLVAERQSSDPSILSRLAVYLDTRSELMANAADRALVDQLPAHLDGEALGRAIRVALGDMAALHAVVDTGTRLRRGQPDDADPQFAAEQGMRIERLIAQVV